MYTSNAGIGRSYSTWLTAVVRQLLSFSRIPRHRKMETARQGGEGGKGDDKRTRRFVTTALVRDKTILSGCAPPRASSDSLILHREHCFQHESSVSRTCPFRFTVPVRSIPESRYSSLWRCTRTIDHHRHRHCCYSHRLQSSISVHGNLYHAFYSNEKYSRKRLIAT